MTCGEGLRRRYPKAFKHTVPEIAGLLPEGTDVFEKTMFSMCTDDVKARPRRGAPPARVDAPRRRRSSARWAASR